MAWIRGVYPIVSVPFDHERSVDYQSYRRLIDHLRQSFPGATLFGVASEFYKLSDYEREQLTEIFLSDCPDGFTAIVSVTAHATELAVAAAVRAEKAGADAISVFPPHFLRPSAKQVSEHYDAIAQAVSIPVMVQCSPDLAASSLSPAAVVALTKRHSNVTAVKVEVSPPGPAITQIVEETGGAVSCFVGYSGLDMLDSFERGGIGVQPASGFAEVHAAISDLWTAGRTDEAHALYERLLPFILPWMRDIELANAVSKTVLARRGLFATDSRRRPTVEIDAVESERIDQFFDRFGSYLGVTEEK
jgi:dihydrodipicolinate synthase/N-acetylneuraminate lyase